MKEKIRNFLWKLLGVNYRVYLNNQRRIIFLDDFKDVEIGNNTYNNGAKVWKWNSNSSLKIGNYCSIANDVNFILDSGNHDMFNITTSPLFHNLYKENEDIVYKGEKYLFKDFKKHYQGNKQSIEIKNEVWIGAGVTILPGVTIGNGAIIMAGAVVSKSVKDFSVVAGVPAEHIKYRFSQEEQNKLLDIAWWDWTDNKVKKYSDDFNLDIKEFIKKHS